MSTPRAISGSSPRTSWAWARLRGIAGSEYLILWLSVVFVAALGPVTPGFLSLDNAANVLTTLLPLYLVAVGQTVVLIAGGIDLSVTSIIALSSVVGARIAVGGTALSPALAVVAMIAVGAGIGLLNGIAIVPLRMPAFLVTLTTMMFFSGLAVRWTRSQNIGNLPESFTFWGSNPWVAAAVALAVGFAAHLALTRTVAGRWLFAVGHNVRAARVSGVPVDVTTILAYAASGVCAALAALVYTGQAETGSPVLGQHVLLDVIGATVLGGTSLFGGKGNVVWTLCGVLFLKLIDNALNLLNLSLFTITMVKGGVILVAAVTDALLTRWQKAR